MECPARQMVPQFSTLCSVPGDSLACAARRCMQSRDKWHKGSKNWDSCVLRAVGGDFIVPHRLFNHIRAIGSMDGHSPIDFEPETIKLRNPNPVRFSKASPTG